MTLESDKKAFDEQVAEFNKNYAEFMAGKKVAATRARGAASQISKLMKTMRVEIQERKNASGTGGG
jgi:hypothetical protein